MAATLCVQLTVRSRLSLSVLLRPSFLPPTLRSTIDIHSELLSTVSLLVPILFSPLRAPYALTLNGLVFDPRPQPSLLDPTSHQAICVCIILARTPRMPLSDAYRRHPAHMFVPETTKKVACGHKDFDHDAQQRLPSDGVLDMLGTYIKSSLSGKEAPPPLSTMPPHPATEEFERLLGQFARGWRSRTGNCLYDPSEKHHAQICFRGRNAGLVMSVVRVLHH